MNPEYISLRQIAQKNNSTLFSNHPCVKGCSDCCTKNVPLSVDDREYIERAINEGLISADTVNEARKKATKSSGRSCPFVNNGCTIYEFRPVICIMTGSGGIPSSSQQVELLNSGEIQGLPVRDLSTTMCSRGHNILANRNTFMTTQSILDMEEITTYYAYNNGGDIQNFACSL